jgi:hypothetical protein
MAALMHGNIDRILSDYSLPAFGELCTVAFDALQNGAPAAN